MVTEQELANELLRRTLENKIARAEKWMGYSGLVGLIAFFATLATILVNDFVAATLTLCTFGCAMVYGGASGKRQGYRYALAQRGLIGPRAPYRIDSVHVDVDPGTRRALPD